MLDIKKICDLYDDNHSIRDIAEIFGTYPNKIARILKKTGKELRSKEEAAKIAVESGKIKPPMLGKKRTQAEKDNISAKRAKKWQEMSKDDLETFKQNAKDRWESQTPEEKSYKQKKAGEALRRASIEGSKAEKSLYGTLTKLGYDVIIHKTGLIPGEKYEIDLYLPSLLVAIEIDGPQHFLPVYGEENLSRNIKYDAIKNGALLSRGICVIRVKYLLKHNSQRTNKQLADAVVNELKKIEQKFPNPEDRLIELEIDHA
jgi:very-short-patch-repair endonuclease